MKTLFKTMYYVLFTVIAVIAYFNPQETFYSVFGTILISIPLVITVLKAYFRYSD